LITGRDVKKNQKRTIAIVLPFFASFSYTIAICMAIFCFIFASRLPDRGRFFFFFWFSPRFVGRCAIISAWRRAYG